MAEEIERGALAGQEAARRTGDGGNDIAGADLGPVLEMATECYCGLHEMEGELSGIETGNDTRLSRNHHQRRTMVCGNDGCRGYVAGKTEIFEKGCTHERFNDKAR